MKLLRKMKKVIFVPWLSLWAISPTHNMWDALSVIEGFSRHLSSSIWTPWFTLWISGPVQPRLCFLQRSCCLYLVKSSRHPHLIWVLNWVKLDDQGNKVSEGWCFSVMGLWCSHLSMLHVFPRTMAHAIFSAIRSSPRTLRAQGTRKTRASWDQPFQWLSPQNLQIFAFHVLISLLLQLVNCKRMGLVCSRQGGHRYL